VSVYEQIFQIRSVLAKHKAAPLLAEREAYLEYHHRHGRRMDQLRTMASHLLRVNRTLGLTALRAVSHDELKKAAQDWASYVGPLRRRLPQAGTYELYLQMARPWLRFNGISAFLGHRSSLFVRGYVHYK
jgi:integrase/recombinase XerD